MLRSLFLSTLILMPVLGQAADDDKMGRLFLTPAERTQLDQLRQGAKSIPSNEMSEKSATPISDQLTLDGFVRRSSGKNTTWINRVPQNEQATSQGVLVLQQRSKPPLISIQVGSGKPLELKAGQTVDLTTGKVREGFEAAAPVSVDPTIVNKQSQDTDAPAAKKTVVGK